MKTGSIFSLMLLLIACMLPDAGLCQSKKQTKYKDSLLTLLGELESKSKNDSITLSDTSKLKVMNKLAIAYFRMSENEKMFSSVAKANELALKLAARFPSDRSVKRELAQSFHSLSIYYQTSGLYPQSLENHFRAVKLKEELGDVIGIAESNNNVGTLYKEQGEYEKALDVYFKVLDVREKLMKEQPDNKSNLKGIAAAYNNIGLIYKLQKKYKEAIDIFTRSLELKLKLGDELSSANTLGNLGTAYTDMKNYDLGMEYHLKSLKIHTDHDDKRGVASTYYNIAENLISRAQEKDSKKNILLREAKDYLDKAFPMAKEMNEASMIKDTYMAYTKICELSGNYTCAMDNFKKFIAFRDSLNNSENLQKSVRAEMNNEFEKKELIAKQKQEAKNALMRSEHQKHKTVRNLFIAGFGCMLVLAILIFRSVRQKQKANHFMELQKQEVELQKNIAEKKQKQILDSINYAQRIQSSILPDLANLKKLFPDCLALYLPKDIVSGDFYWFAQIPSTNEIMIVVADCTGHGVPGAFLSMVGSTLLNEIVIHKHITDPSQIVKELSYGLSLTMINKEDEHVDIDGMDVSICLIDKTKCTLSFAGVNQYLYVIDSSGSRKIEPQISSEDGIFDLNATVSLSTIKEQLEPDTSLYILTDGFAAELNHNGVAFGEERLNELLTRIHTKSSQEQESVLKAALSDWRGKGEHVDDILILGIRL